MVYLKRGDKMKNLKTYLQDILDKNTVVKKLAIM